MSSFGGQSVGPRLKGTLLALLFTCRGVFLAGGVPHAGNPPSSASSSPTWKWDFNQGAFTFKKKRFQYGR
jgi:hypothetical protein